MTAHSRDPSAAARTAPAIQLPPAASQHKTAGPYSPVLLINASTIVAISGQGPIDLEGRIVGRTLQEQARLTLENCRRVLADGGAAFRDVFKVTVYLSDMNDWAAFNEVYREYFEPPYPVRTAIQAVLWGGIKVEIDMLAALPADTRSPS